VKFHTRTHQVSGAHWVLVGFVKNGSKINKSGLDRPAKENMSHAPTPIGAKLEPDPNPIQTLEFYKHL
jgi:hypothetical protein